MGARRRTLLVVLVALAAGCASSDEPLDPTTSTTTTTTTTSTTATSASSTSSTTTTTTTIAPPATTTTTARGRAAWPSARAVDEALGLELTVTTSSQDIGADEQATFAFRIRNTSETGHVVYNSNTDFIHLDGARDGDHWAPFCGARPAVLTYADLAPGASIEAHDVAYPGDGGPEPCPRPAPGDYDLVVTIYGCRQSRPHGEGADCDDGSSAQVRMPVRQR